MFIHNIVFSKTHLDLKKKNNLFLYFFLKYTLNCVIKTNRCSKVDSRNALIVPKT